MADQSQDPEHPDPKPGEAGFGPGEEGDSIEAVSYTHLTLPTTERV